jgi:hypothetical protein
MQQMFSVNELIVVDSQNLQWLKTNDDKAFDLKPDLFFCKDNLFEACEEYKGDSIYKNMLDYIASEKQNNANFHYHFGRVIWPLKQLTSIVEVKVNIEDDKNEYIGQIINYINFLSNRDLINTYHGVLMDNRSAYLFSSHNGTTKKGVECNLRDGGTFDLIKSFILPKNDLFEALDSFLQIMQLELTKESKNKSAFLGNGRDGFVFVVRYKNSNNSYNSNNAHNPPMALKILINETNFFFFFKTRFKNS